MTFDKWFNSQSRLIQIILLIIPGVNYIVELLVRLSVYLRKKDAVSLVIFLISALGIGFILGYVDLIWVLLFNHLFLGE